MGQTSCMHILQLLLVSCGRVIPVLMLLWGAAGRHHTIRCSLPHSSEYAFDTCMRHNTDMKLTKVYRSILHTVHVQHQKEQPARQALAYDTYTMGWHIACT